MGIFTNSNRVSDNISTFFGYDNTSGSEIKVKATREKEIILTITDANDKSGKFVFKDADLDTLVRFEIMMTNIFSIYETFSLHYGIKRNRSDKGISISIDDPTNISFRISAIPDHGVTVSVIEKNKAIDFIFKDADKDILSRFKIEFGRLVANISHMKLPAKQQEIEGGEV